MGKGSDRELDARKLYERAGYWVYTPENSRYGDNDLWNLFDLACFRVLDHSLRFVQVKSNGARGITKWVQRAAHFAEMDAVTVEYAVPYDREGWRIVQPDADGDGYTTVYDERDDPAVDSNYPDKKNMGDGLVEWLEAQAGGES